MRGSSLPVPAGSAGEITRLSSGEQAALRLRELIFDGLLQPQARIPQNQIAESFGISRIPLREALIALELEGWVTLQLHRGAFVNSFDESTLIDHYEMLGIVFGFAARRALERGGPTLVPELRRIQAELREVSDPAAAGELLRSFSYGILAAAHSGRVVVLLRSIPSLIPGDIFTMIPEVVDVERAMVDDVVSALSAGDANGAAEAFEFTMKAVGEQVARVFRDRRLLQA